jgi:molybdopterin synthase sulfur carrier subunit
MLLADKMVLTPARNVIKSPQQKTMPKQSSMNRTASRDAGLTPAHRLARAATITVSVPTPLRRYCAGASELALSAPTLRAVLEELERRYPELHRSICDETGAVRRHINLFANSDHMRDCNGLDTSLKAGDVVTIMTAVSGG